MRDVDFRITGDIGFRVHQLTAQLVQAQSDGQPDYKSFYFATTSACYESYTGGIRNPNSIVAQQYMIDFPLSPNTTATPMRAVDAANSRSA